MALFTQLTKFSPKIFFSLVRCSNVSRNILYLCHWLSIRLRWISQFKFAVPRKMIGTNPRLVTMTNKTYALFAVNLRFTLLTPGSDAELFMSLIHWIQFMKILAPESTRNACFNLERLMQPFFSPIPAGNFTFGATLEQLWFRCWTFHVPNLKHKLL